MSAITAVMKKEVRDAFSNWWLLLYGGLFTLLALGLSYLGQKNLGSLGFENFSRTTASLLNLCLLLAPLIALSLGAGAIAGERDRGALTYLLSQPLERRELLLGKFAGLFASIGLATTAGFGAAGIVISLSGSAMDAGTYLLFLFLVLALIAVMTGLGLVASVVSATRVQALGLAVLVWFAAVFFFDLVLIGMVSATSLGDGGLLLALLANPVEIAQQRSSPPYPSSRRLRGGEDIASRGNRRHCGHGTPILDRPHEWRRAAPPEHLVDRRPLCGCVVSQQDQD